MSLPNTLRRFDPRLHLAAAIGWAVFTIVTLAALVGASLAAAEAEARARADAQALLAEFATEVRDVLSLNLQARRTLLQATAAQLAVAPGRSPAIVARILGALQAQYPEFVRLVAYDEEGRLIGLQPPPPAPATAAAADPAASAALPRDFWTRAREHPVVSDRRALPRPAGAPDAPELPAVERVLDLAVPLDLSEGPTGPAGLLAAELDWAWVEQIVSRMQVALRQHRRLELLLASRDGILLIGPPDWLGRRLAPDHPHGGAATASSDDLSEGGRHVIGRRTNLRMADNLGFGWTALVRQPTEEALASVRLARRNVFLIVFLAGLLAAAGAMAVTRMLTRRLSLLAEDAEAVRRGDRSGLVARTGRDEVGRIGRTLAMLVDHLQAEKAALQGLNADLDQRVAERTRRIERLADEARQAAVTRERLRLARDLHDTLAHSLMALLTQVRLIRKLHTRMAPEELEEELGRAEAVTATGLTEARAAIAQMRDHGVRDTGLGPALQDLVRRFRHRTGVAVDLQATGPACDWAGERAETVFRIVEEALRNIERHADARQVRLSLQPLAEPETGGAAADPLRASQARLEVVDDGRGFDPSHTPPGHYGLRGMQEQALLADARLRLTSQPGAGTRVQLDFAL